MTSLYLHIPFCQRKCFYCSFRVVIGQEKRTAVYLDALETEARLYAGKIIDTVYFGGGTPAYLSNDELRRLMAIVRKYFQLTSGCEITLEANPENLSFEKSQCLFDLGINRISLGIQTFQDAYLKYLGRVHDAAKAMKAFEDLRQAGFRNINVDLMYAFPQQSSDDLNVDLKTLLALGSEHVSLYTLTVEENSRFYAQKLLEKDAHTQGDLFDQVVETLQRAGVHQYEISNFARPGFESQHNQNYWRGGDYFGLGMSSHAHHQGRRSWNVSRFQDYLSRLAQQQSPEEGFEILPVETQQRETLLFGLRMNIGVNLSTLQQRYALPLPLDLLEKIASLKAEGFLVQEGDQLRATAQGRKVLDDIAVRLI